MKRITKRLIRRLGGELPVMDDQSPDQIVFIHIGKNAGTQIKYLSRQINEIQDDRRITWYGHRLTLRDIPEDIPFFFSVRDPVSRFKSGFYSRKRKGQPRTYNEWIAAENEAFSRFEHANDLAEALYSKTQDGEHAMFAMNNIGHVREHQIHWFEAAGIFLENKRPVWIIRHEHFERDFRAFLKNANLPVDYEKLQTADDDNRAHAFNYSGTPELTPLARKNLLAWYSRDVEFYNACENWVEKSAP